MKKIALVALAALAMGSMEAQAADYGIGVSVKSNDSIIYAPVEFNDKLRLEPNIRYNKNEINGGDTKVETLQFGVGLFGLSAANKSIRLYYGGRVAYVDQEVTQQVLIQQIVAFPVFSSPARVTNNTHGFRYSPTIGFEFLFNERLSLGGEAEYFFQDLNGDFDSKSNGTDTRLILRFKF